MIGHTLDHDSIVAKVGAARMGEVYRVHVIRLWRDVTTKAVIAALARNPERVG